MVVVDVQLRFHEKRCYESKNEKERKENERNEKKKNTTKMIRERENEKSVFEESGMDQSAVLFG